MVDDITDVNDVCNLSVWFTQHAGIRVYRLNQMWIIIIALYTVILIKIHECNISHALWNSLLACQTYYNNASL